MQRMTLIAILLLSTVILSAAGVKVMTYNSLNFNDDDTDRIDDFETVFDQISPDILVMQEMVSEDGAELMLTALNDDYDDYGMSDFINGNDSDNILFYKKSSVKYIDMDYIETDLREIAEYEVEVYGNPLRIYSCHLKASQGNDNEQQRLAEVTVLRHRLNNLPSTAEFIILGDMNIYSSDEPAYQKFIASESDNDGRARDTIDEIGNWHDNSSFVNVHTQSTRTEQQGGGATGGLDDRFDYMFINYDMNNGSGIDFINDSVVPFGNDGNHFNQAINSGTNSAVPAYVANALHDASDHLPVFAKFKTADGTSSILDYFRVNMDATIEWTTVDESELIGYNLYRSSTNDIDDAVQINSNIIAAMNAEEAEYSFQDTAPTGYYYYWLEIVALDGNMEMTYPLYHGVVSNDEPTIPEYTNLQVEPNYPNPFNPVTTISFTLAEESHASVDVFNIKGEKVRVLSNERMSAGSHNLVWDGSDDMGNTLSSGIYFCRVVACGDTKVLRMLMMK